MNKILFAYSTIVLLGFNLNANCQTRLKQLYDISPGVNYPVNMPRVRSWIDSTLSRVFISNLQNSTSSNGDNTFISFSLIGKTATTLPLFNTGGFKLTFASISPPPQLRTQQLAMNYENGLKAYRIPYNPKTFDYSLESYFYLALGILRINGNQLFANTFNMMVNDQAGKDKYDQFLDDVNKKMGTNMPYLTNKTINALRSAFDKQFPRQASTIIYQTYIEVKNDQKKTLNNLERFFYVTGFFKDGLIYKIDDLTNPNIKVGLKNPESLVIPITIASPLQGSKAIIDSLVHFQFTNINGVLNYKDRKLEIELQGTSNQPVLLKSFKTGDYADGKLIFVKPKSKVKSKSLPTAVVSFNKMKLVISEVGVSMQVFTKDDLIYQISESTWK